MKDIKTTLKEAREAIKNKDYDMCIKLCKGILKIDSDNYFALVFLGLSLQEVGPVDRTVSAFRKAIQLNDTNPLAWTGLASYYEKHPSDDSTRQLPMIYAKLLQIETDESKIAEICHKLTNASDLGTLSDEVILKLCNLPKKGKYSKKLTSDLWICLTCMLKHKMHMDGDFQDLYKEGLQALLKSDPTAQRWDDMFELLHHQQQLDQICEILNKWPKDRFTATYLTWKCKVFTYSYIEHGVVKYNAEELQQAIDQLKETTSVKVVITLTEAVFLMISGAFYEAVVKLKNSLRWNCNEVYLWLALSQSYMKLHLWLDALDVVNKISNTKKKMNFVQNVCNKILMECLSSSDDGAHWVECTHLYENMDKNAQILFVVLCYIRAHMNLQHYDICHEMLDQIHDTLEHRKCDWYKWYILKVQVYSKQGDLHKALDLLENQCLDEDRPWEWWLQLGLTLNAVGKNGLSAFLKAAKLAPCDYVVFYQLGLHYANQQNDWDKSRRCLERAFKLNPKSRLVGIELSQVYRKLKLWTNNLNLLETLTGEGINKENSWAFMQLGLTYMEQENYDFAIKNLRKVIAINSLNTNCWESLADSYLARGAYTSALKCYEKAIDCGSDTLYPTLQIANIRKMLGQYVEATEQFERILCDFKTYVPALKGIAETLFYDAKRRFREHRYGTARDLIENAIRYISIALQQNHNFSCLWKLLAECCVFVTKLPSRYCCILINASLMSINSTENGRTIAEQNDLFELAARSYAQCIRLDDDEETKLFLWYDLACCYLSQARCDIDQRDQLLDKCHAISEYCVSETNIDRAEFWNIHGLVEFYRDSPNYAQVQHAFIRAVQVDKNFSIGWCNLGVMYFKLEEYALANESFAQAQRSEVEYPNSWIGQAIIAEHMQYDDAMDLFRHSTQLGMNLQGAIGYAYWVCQTLKKKCPRGKRIYSIHNMHAIPIACDAMSRYVAMQPDDACALTMLGFLQERMGLIKSALESYKRALALCDASHEDICKINYGRMLTKIEDYDQAIAAFKTVSEATLSSQVCLALALFKGEEHENSYDAYKSALHWLADEHTAQSELLIALASMAYMFEGAESAKTLLFQSLQLENASPWSYFATMALALLHSDEELASLTFAEICMDNIDQSFHHHYAKLLAYLHLLEGDEYEAVRALSKIVHMQPDNAEMWKILSETVLRTDHRRRFRAAASCAVNAMKLGQASMDVTKIWCLVSLASTLSTCTKDRNVGMIAAQKAVHYYPHLPEAWAVFLFACTHSAGPLSSVIHRSRVRNIFTYMDCHERLRKWISSV